MTEKPTYKELEQRIRELEHSEIELRHSRKKLHQQKAFLELLMETIPLPIFYKGMDGRYKGCNRAFEEFVGRPREEIIGKTMSEMASRAISDIYKEKDDELYKKPGKHRHELKVKGKNGFRDVIFDKAIILGSRNNPEGLIGVITDITERKKSEGSLRQSEAFIKSVMDNLPIGIAVNSVGPVVKFEYMNDNFLKFYRINREDLSEPGVFWDVIYEEPEFREKIRKQVLEDCSSGDPKRMQWEDVPITRKNDETFFIAAKNIPVPDKQLMISTVWDVTDRKRAETEREKLQAQLMQAQKIQAVGRLAGGVAHDFNNMLGVILGHADMALDHVDPLQPIYEDLLEIQKAAQRSADLTRQLLAFARKQTISPRVLDLNDTISGMLKMLRRLTGEDIDLVWKPGANLWPVMMDPAQIDQILANLAINARDALEGAGNLTIETQNMVFDESYCSAHAGFVPGEYVLLGVSDTGCGMNKEVLDNLFEPFFTTKEVGKGTGMGLATIYGVVKQNNGFVNVYSEPGEGTSFKIYLPRIQASETAGIKVMEPEPSGGAETILLVEDDTAILRLGKMILERYGYTVLAAASPSEAITMAKEHEGTVHLLITDVVMHGMNGKQLKENILALRPDIKTLFMSGYTANVIAHHGVIEENVEYLQKPFSVKTLAARVREVL